MLLKDPKYKQNSFFCRMFLAIRKVFKGSLQASCNPIRLLLASTVLVLASSKTKTASTNIAAL